MEKNLETFMKNVKILNKNFAQFEDEKGFYLLIGTAQLISGVSYNELSEPELKSAIFNQAISKEDGAKEYNKITIFRPVADEKSNKDGQIEMHNKEVVVSQVWIVRNQLGLSKAFNNKEEALKMAKDINEKVINVIGE